MIWRELLTTWVGQLSLFVVVFGIGMVIWFIRFFLRNIAEEEAAAARTGSSRPAQGRSGA